MGVGKSEKGMHQYRWHENLKTVFLKYVCSLNCTLTSCNLATVFRNPQVTLAIYGLELYIYI